MQARERRKAFLLFLVVAAALAIQQKVGLPGYTRMWKAVGDAGHIPLFGLMSLAFLGLSYIFLKNKFKDIRSHYLAALIATALVGTLSEIMQINTNRDADINDFLRDVGGAISFLSLYVTYDPRLKEVRRKWGRKLTFWAWGISLLFITICSLTIGLVTVAYIERYQAFPIICDFEHGWQERFLILCDAELKLVPAPSGWKGAGQGHVGRVVFNHATYPGFHIKEPYPDWRNYSTLAFEIYSELDTTVTLNVRVDDSHHRGLYQDRYNTVIRINPGLNRINIPLAKVQNGPKSRKMDMIAIRAIGLFASRPPAPFTLYLDNFRLE